MAEALPRVDGVHVPAPHYQPGAYVVSDASMSRLIQQADGSLVKQIMGAGLVRIDIQWKGLSAANVALLWAWYDGHTAQLWEDVEGDSYMVRPMLNTWRKSSWGAPPGLLWDVQFSVKGVAA